MPIEPRVTWLLGGPRTGSSWLMDMLVHPLMAAPEPASGARRRVPESAVRPRAVPVNEPYLGVHLAPIVTVHPVNVFTAADARTGDAAYFFDPRYERVWRPALARLVRARLAAQGRAAGREHRIRSPLLIVKEPNGSHAAPMLSATLPRSRLLVLWRDGRDVIDSTLDAVAPGGWLAGGYDTEAVAAGGAARREFLRRNAVLWVHRTRMVRQAAAAHDPARVLEVRYEDLRGDTATQLRRIADWLGLGWSDAALREVLATHSFDAYPPDVKGRGRPLREARPGAWREHLAPDEQLAATEVMRAELTALGYEA